MSSKRTVLITGANQGLGYELALKIGVNPAFHVILACRSETRGNEALEKLKAAGVQSASLLVVDITNPSSISAATEILTKDYPSGLDVLVNNAGVALGGTTLEDFQTVYSVNVFGAALMTEALTPLLKKSVEAGKADKKPAPQLLFLSSELGSLAKQSDPESTFYKTNYLAYNSSKAALNMLMVGYSKDLKESGVVVSGYDPGYVATALNGYSGPGEASKGIERLAELILEGDENTGKYYKWTGEELPW
ncbi:short chain oxidoreductase [Aulographum hederae CBS 113979]|uniref:Short chain oxidoreductase n=1 Tax=Aulographum hederae CBS 113979 TaxID=1176131 RepID=A0A6G1HB39_9PEZI|nr:short chain oxidoreductase [Aulographum hederae CBS 113979]